MFLVLRSCFHLYHVPHHRSVLISPDLPVIYLPPSLHRCFCVLFPCFCPCWCRMFIRCLLCWWRMPIRRRFSVGCICSRATFSGGGCLFADTFSDVGFALVGTFVGDRCTFDSAFLFPPSLYFSSIFSVYLFSARVFSSLLLLLLQCFVSGATASAMVWALGCVQFFFRTSLSIFYVFLVRWRSVLCHRPLFSVDVSVLILGFVY